MRTTLNFIYLVKTSSVLFETEQEHAKLLTEQIIEHIDVVDHFVAAGISRDKMHDHRKVDKIKVDDFFYKGTNKTLFFAETYE
jgi:hypothetical protein